MCYNGPMATRHLRQETNPMNDLDAIARTFAADDSDDALDVPTWGPFFQESHGKIDLMVTHERIKGWDWKHAVLDREQMADFLRYFEDDHRSPAAAWSLYQETWSPFGDDNVSVDWTTRRIR